MQPVSLDHSDLVYGSMTFPVDLSASDPILLKSDGWPTYHLANVVDDHLMGVTHVLRGEEWLPSVPKHLALYAALGLEPPVFAHLPLLVNKDGSKLSKRSGDVHVQAYREQGWEAEALVNWVALLGYNHHGGQQQQGGVSLDNEVLSMDDLISSFDPSRIAHSRATPDPTKLAFLNRRHLFAATGTAKSARRRDDVVARLRSSLPAETSATWSDEYLSRVIDLVSERASRLCEVPGEADYLLTQKDELEGWAFGEKEGEALRIARDALAALGERVDAGSSWQAASLQGALDTAAAQAPSRKAALRAMRLALTGRKTGPTLVEVMEVLGRERTLRRLDAAVASATTPAAAA